MNGQDFEDLDSHFHDNQTAAADISGDVGSGTCTGQYGVDTGGAWRGPYVDNLNTLDPWDNPIVMVVNAGGKDTASLALSAGSDGVLDTTIGSTNAVGDDVAAQIVLKR